MTHIYMYEIENGVKQEIYIVEAACYQIYCYKTSHLYSWIRCTGDNIRFIIKNNLLIVYSLKNTRKKNNSYVIPFKY